MAGRAVGIDLGTTNSVVAVAQGGRPRVLALPDGSILIPSIVSFHPNGQTLVGAEARARRAVDPANTVFSVKRLLGRPFSSEEVRRASERFAFELREGPDQAILVHSRAGDLSLPEISALVLREVRRIAEESLGEKVDRAVVTVPANFNELQRSATKAAGQIADIDVIRILNEPTAAALAYGYGRGTRERIAVYDFGGGTFDVTLLELSGNVFEVLATAGDTFLGGDDLDLLIAENLADGVQQSLKIDARRDRRAFELLRDAAETAKIELSTQDVATIRIPEIGYGPSGRALEFRTRISRAELEKLAGPLVERTISVCAEALRLAGLKANDFQSVILVGGSSRIPAVHARVTGFFGRDPLMSLPPEHVVALGASILAEALTGGRRRPQASAAPGTTAPQASPTGFRPSQSPGAPSASPQSNRPSSAIAPVSGNTLRPGGAGVGATPRGRTSTIQGSGDGVASPSAGVGPGPGGARPSDFSWKGLRTPTKPPVDQLDEPTGEVSTLPRFDPRQRADEPTQRYDPIRTTADLALPSRPPAAGGPPGFALPSMSDANAFDDENEVTRVGLDPRSSEAQAASDRQVTDRELPAFGAGRTGGPDPITEPRHRESDLQKTAPRPTFPFDAGDTFDPPTDPRAVRPPAAPQPVAPERKRQDTSDVVTSVGANPARRSGLGGAVASNRANVPEEPTAEREVPRWTDSYLGFPAVMPNVPASSPSVSPRAAAAVPAVTPGPTAEPPGSPPAGEVARWTDSYLGFPAVHPPAAPDAAPPTLPTPLAAPPASPTPLAAPPTPLAAAPASTPAAPPPLVYAPPAPPIVAPPPVAPPALQSAQLPSSPSARSQPSSMPPFGSLPPPPAPLLIDVTPHSLGIETVGGLCEFVIPRNATIPIEQSREFATSYDAQEGVRIRIAQGESRRFGENQPLGELELLGLTRAPRGEVTIEVTFELDANGTLGVRAREKATGRTTQARLGLLTMPTAAEVASMALRQRGSA